MQALKSNNRIRGVSGVTLAEILIVVVIIGILASFAIPQINLTRYRIESAMQGIGTTMLAAQRRAVTRQHDIILLFDQAAQVVRLHEDANNDAVVQATERVLSYPLGDNVVFGLAGATARAMGGAPVNFVKTIGGLPALTFHRNGSASEQGGFYLTSRRALMGGQNPDDTRALEVERATGRVSWFRYRTTGWTRGF